jgi:ABC-type thiamine transport system ATPase subunit
MRELQLIGFNTDRTAVQCGISPSWGAAAQDKEKWRKLAARLSLAPVETKPITAPSKRGRNRLSLSICSVGARRRPV